MDKLKWIIVITIFVIWTGLAVFSGYHLKKDKVCPEIRADTVYVEKTDTVHQTFTKFIKGRIDTVFVDSSKQIQTITANELIDTVIIFQNDSLDFVADINFSTKDQKFENFFDFNLRVSQRIKEVVKEVLVPMKPEIWQNGWVILLMVITSFLFGITL